MRRFSLWIVDTTMSLLVDILWGPVTSLKEVYIHHHFSFFLCWMHLHLDGIEALFEQQRSSSVNSNNNICFVFHCEFSSHRGPYAYDC